MNIPAIHLNRRHALPGILLPILAVLLSAATCSAQSFQYEYDSVGRLIRVQHPDGSYVDYVYDNLGNRLAKSTTLSGAPANNPPSAPANVYPPNGTTNIPTAGITLEWSSSTDPDAGDAVSYFSYLGDSVPTPLLSSGTGTNAATGKLKPRTTYNWLIAARDNHNAASTGSTWSFTTGDQPPEADFGADYTAGWPPLTVQFRDRSISEDGDIIAWAWDFQNDGIVDSNSEDAVYTYSNVGSYSVTFRVGSEHGATGSITRTNWITVLDEASIDFTPTNFRVIEAGPFRHLTVAYDVVNLATQAVPGAIPWRDAVHASDNAILDFGDSQVATFYENQALPADFSYARTGQVTIIPGSLQDYLVFETDTANQVAESNENNNTISVQLTQLPDLVPTNLNSSGTADAGSTITAIYHAVNNGSLPLDGTWNDHIYLSTNTSLGVEDTLIGTKSQIIRLEPGAVYTSAVAVTLPTEIAPGDYYLVLSIDNDDFAVESNEQNNVLSSMLPVVFPDLAPLTISVPGGAGGGQVVDVVYTVTNAGDGTAKGLWCDNLFLSSNTVLDINDTDLGPWCTLTNLQGGSTYTATNNATLPAWPIGTYYLFVVTDHGEQLYELDESNNTSAAAAITFDAPDLVPISIVAPGTTAVGTTIPVITTVSNQGSAAAIPFWLDQLYFSPDPFISTQDVMLAIVPQMSTVTVGSVYSYSNDAALPASVPEWIEVIPGAHLAPYTNGMSTGSIQRDYWNGISGNAVTDLTASASFPDSPSGSGNIGSFEGPSNNGDNYGARIHGFLHPPTSGVYRFWIAGDEQAELWLSPDDNPSNKQLIASVPSATGTRQWTNDSAQQSALVPLTLGNKVYIEALHKEGTGSDHLAVGWRRELGVHYLVYRADNDGQVLEGNEANNDLAVEIILSAPDLAPSIVSAPGVGFAEADLPVTLTVTNIGNATATGASGDWMDGLYLSTNMTLDGGDEMIGLWLRMSPLAGETAYSWSDNAFLPAWTPGSYYLIMKTDTSDQVAELDNANNETAVPFMLLANPPDLAAELYFAMPDPVEVGSTISINGEVRNDGAAAGVTNWVDRILLSRDQVPDAYDYGLAETSHVESIPAFGNWFISESGTIPFWPTGTYYLILLADANEDILEAVTTNNTGVLSFPITITATDSDADGLPNAWENLYFPGSGTTWNADSDLDGMINWEELLANTDPTDASSVLRVFSFSSGGDTFTVTWQGGSTSWQVVEANTNPTAHATWRAIFTNPPPTPTTNLLLDTSTKSQFFFRVRSGN